MKIPAARQGVGDMPLDFGVHAVEEAGIVLSEHSVPISRLFHELLGDRVHIGPHDRPTVAQILRDRKRAVHVLDSPTEPDRKRLPLRAAG
jgi:hypothetical protein